MEAENKVKDSKHAKPSAGIPREGTSFDLLSQNKENGGREQGKGFQIQRTAYSDGNNLICLVKTKRMEV